MALTQILLTLMQASVLKAASTTAQSSSNLLQGQMTPLETMSSLVSPADLRPAWSTSGLSMCPGSPARERLVSIPSIFGTAPPFLVVRNRIFPGNTTYHVRRVAGVAAEVRVRVSGTYAASISGISVRFHTRTENVSLLTLPINQPSIAGTAASNVTLLAITLDHTPYLTSATDQTFLTVGAKVAIVAFASILFLFCCVTTWYLFQHRTVIRWRSTPPTSSKSTAPLLSAPNPNDSAHTSPQKQSVTLSRVEQGLESSQDIPSHGASEAHEVSQRLQRTSKVSPDRHSHHHHRHRSVSREQDEDGRANDQSPSGDTPQHHHHHHHHRHTSPRESTTRKILQSAVLLLGVTLCVVSVNLQTSRDLILNAGDACVGSVEVEVTVGSDTVIADHPYAALIGRWHNLGSDSDFDLVTSIVSSQEKDLPCNGLHEICPLYFGFATFPGTHNSAAYQLALSTTAVRDQVPPLVVDCLYDNQQRTIADQLADGLRTIDLDLCTHNASLHAPFPGMPETYTATSTVVTCHGPDIAWLVSHGTPLVRVLDQIRAFLETNPREMVILLFSDTPQHEGIPLLVSIVEDIRTVFCSSDPSCNSSLLFRRSMWESQLPVITIDALMATNQRLMLVYPRSVGRESVIPDWMYPYFLGTGTWADSTVTVPELTQRIGSVCTGSGTTPIGVELILPGEMDTTQLFACDPVAEDKWGLACYAKCPNSTVTLGCCLCGTRSSAGVYTHIQKRPHRWVVDPGALANKLSQDVCLAPKMRDIVSHGALANVLNGSCADSALNYVNVDMYHTDAQFMPTLREWNRRNGVKYGPGAPPKVSMLAWNASQKPDLAMFAPPSGSNQGV